MGVPLYFLLILGFCGVLGFGIMITEDEMREWAMRPPATAPASVIEHLEEAERLLMSHTVNINQVREVLERMLKTVGGPAAAEGLPAGVAICRCGRKYLRRDDYSLSGTRSECGTCCLARQGRG